MTRILALLGPTASGKSDLALEVAAMRKIPILSVDSMQVYRGLDIGTAKPTAAEQAKVRHLMIDLVEPDTEYSVAEFQQEARRLLAQEDEVLIVGGSGLHLRSIVDPLEFPPTDRQLRASLEAIEDPVAQLIGADAGASEVLDLANPRRVVRALEILHLTGMTPTARSQHESRHRFEEYVPLLEFTAVGIDPGHLLMDLIEERVQAMRAAGWWEEVERLGNSLGRTAAMAVGYRELREAQAGVRNVDRVWGDIAVATRGLAKRQRTYFRRDPRISWVSWSSDRTARMEAVERALGLP